jgi:hypothetical protein
MIQTIRLAAIALSIVMILCATYLIYDSIHNGHIQTKGKRFFMAALCAIIFVLYAVIGDKINAGLWLFNTSLWTMMFLTA